MLRLQHLGGGVSEEEHEEVQVGWGTQLLPCVAVLLKVSPGSPVGLLNVPAGGYHKPQLLTPKS